jgi:Valyl-tRNA synthetase
MPKTCRPKNALKLLVKNGEHSTVKEFWTVIRKLANISEVTFIKEAPAGNTVPFVVGTTELFIPLEGQIDVAREREALQKEIDYHRGFLASVEKKLSNEKFVNSAPPHVVEMERKKKADAEARIAALTESLKRL